MSQAFSMLQQTFECAGDRCRWLQQMSRYSPIVVAGDNKGGPLKTDEDRDIISSSGGHNTTK